MLNIDDGVGGINGEGGESRVPSSASEQSSEGWSIVSDEDEDEDVDDPGKADEGRGGGGTIVDDGAGDAAAQNAGGGDDGGGALILGGDEDEDGGANSEDSAGGAGSAAEDPEELDLSVPETVFLPSEIDSLEDDRMGRSRESVERSSPPLRPFVIAPSGSGRPGGGGDPSPPTASPPAFRKLSHGAIAAAIVAGVAAAVLPALEQHYWRSHAIRLREERDGLQRSLSEERARWERREKSLIPFAAVLLLERGALRDEVEVLREELRAQEDNREGFSNNDDYYPLIDNCYVRASLSPGDCSNEWREWWYGENVSDEYPTFFDNSSQQDGYHDDTNGRKAQNEHTSSSFSDNVAPDNAVHGLFHEMADTYSFVQNNVHSMDYGGLRDSLLDSFVHGSSYAFAANDTQNRSALTFMGNSSNDGTDGVANDTTSDSTEDGFYRTAQGLLHGMAEASAQTYSFVRRNVEDLTYIGLRDSLLASSPTLKDSLFADDVRKVVGAVSNASLCATYQNAKVGGKEEMSRLAEVAGSAVEDIMKFARNVEDRFFMSSMVDAFNVAASS